MSFTCPICEATNLVEMSESLFREDADIVLHENENYKHVRHGHIEVLVRTEANIKSEKEDSRLLEVA